MQNTNAQQVMRPAPHRSAPHVPTLIARLREAGYSNRQIAQRLDISESQVWRYTKGQRCPWETGWQLLIWTQAIDAQTSNATTQA